MKKLIFLPILIIIFLSIFVKNLIDQPKNVVYVPSKITLNPLIETSFKDVVFLDWDKSLLDIAKIYLKGEMYRKSPKENALSSYCIDAKLTDINESVALSFHQNEEFIRGESQNNISIRQITFSAQSPSEQKIKFNSICDLISTYGQGILPLKGEDTYDASYIIYNSDNSSGTSIGLKMERNINNSIDVDISTIEFLGKEEGSD